MPSLSLRGNRLTELPEGLFNDLLDQWLPIATMDLGHNRLTAISPTIFQTRAGYCRKIHNHLEGNQLTTLPPRVFEGVTVKQLQLHSNNLTYLPPGAFDGLVVDQLYLQNNDLTELHAESFRDLGFREKGSTKWGPKRTRIFDVSRNQLQALAPKIFDFGAKDGAG